MENRVMKEKGTSRRLFVGKGCDVFFFSSLLKQNTLEMRSERAHEAPAFA